MAQRKATGDAHLGTDCLRLGAYARWPGRHHLCSYRRIRGILHFFTPPCIARFPLALPSTPPNNISKHSRVPDWTVRPRPVHSPYPQHDTSWRTKRYMHTHTMRLPILMHTQGASPRELVLEACRRNNTELLEETLKDLGAAASKSGKKPEDHVADVLNNARDGVGNGCLHVAATYGSCKYLRTKRRSTQDMLIAWHMSEHR